jgi:hypothetical protein
VKKTRRTKNRASVPTSNRGGSPRHEAPTSMSRRARF